MHYQKELQPGQSVDYFFKLPAVPVGDAKVVNQVLAAIMKLNCLQRLLSGNNR